MSRSKKHTPIIGNTVADSEKQDKRFANRKHRRYIRAILSQEAAIEVLPTLREVSDVWNMAKDGKRWVMNYSKALRK